MNKKIPLAVLDTDGGMYQSERKIYPRDIDGRFQRLRKIAVFWLLGMYYVFPWLTWGDHQAVLFDLPARKFHILGLTFWPQDFFLLSWLLIIAALSLFFFTALAGRLWCGYACPQTVWTEVFLWMEQWAEGDRMKRMKLDAAPMSAAKFGRKFAKQAMWIGFALWTGFTFVGFFTPIRHLAAEVASLALGGWETFWILFYALATYGNAGYLREQVCKYMCPYARFQSAMFDRNTLIIAYDTARGETRGPRRRGVPSVLARAQGPVEPGAPADRPIPSGASAPGRHSKPLSQLLSDASSSLNDPEAADPKEAVPAAPSPGIAGPTPSDPEASGDASGRSTPGHPLGDCINCTLCVQVCPTGIDIRDGLQYECIACGACVDACDEVMEKLDYPRGLIRYATQNAVDHKATRVLRPRVVLYGLLLLGFILGFAWVATHRTPLIVDVLRDRNALYRQRGDGSIENAYTLMLANKDASTRRFRISLESSQALALVGADDAIEVGAGQVASVPVTVIAAAGKVHGKNEIVFVTVRADDDAIRTRQKSSFFGPFN